MSKDRHGDEIRLIQKMFVESEQLDRIEANQEEAEKLLKKLLHEERHDHHGHAHFVLSIGPFTEQKEL